MMHVWSFLFAVTNAELKALGNVVLCLDWHHTSLERKQINILLHDTLGRHVGDSHMNTYKGVEGFPSAWWTDSRTAFTVTLCSAGWQLIPLFTLLSVPSPSNWHNFEYLSCLKGIAIFCGCFLKNLMATLINDGDRSWGKTSRPLHVFQSKIAAFWWFTW